MSRRGFALLAVLWTVTALAGVVGAAIAAVRMTDRAVANRLALARGRWGAEACLAIAQARWRAGRLSDTGSVDLGRAAACGWRLDDPSARLNVNSADRATLVRLAIALGFPRDSAAAIASAVETTRARRLIPDVRALEEVGVPPVVRAHLTVDGPGTANINAAAPAVLAALPGLTLEAVSVVTARRPSGRPFINLEDLAQSLSAAGRAELLAAYPQLIRLVVFAPPQLVLTADGWEPGGGPFPRATIELLVVPLQGRLAVMRRRMW